MIVWTVVKSTILVFSIVAAMTASGIAHRAPAHLYTRETWNTPQAISEIEHQLPLLLADSLNAYKLRAVVDFVMTDDWNAVALWSAGKYRGLVILHRDYADRWRWVGAATSDDPKIVSWSPMSRSRSYLAFCDRTVSGPPSAYSLYQGGWISEELEARLEPRLKQVPISDDFEVHLCDRFHQPDKFQIEDSFDVRFYPTVVPDTPITFVGSEPRAARDPRATPRRAIFTFSIYASDATDIQIINDRSLAIWFPYVLDADRHYLVRIVQPSLSPELVRGKLQHNVLTFSLPKLHVPKAMVVYGTVYAE